MPTTLSRRQAATALLCVAATLPVSAAPQVNMQAALKNLQQAHYDLTHANSNKGGHRAKALRLVEDAIAEVKRGIAAGN